MTHQPLSPQARKRKRRKQSPHGEMPLLDHLKELQRRLFYATIAILVGTGFGYFWYGTNLGPVPSLGELLRGPYCALPPEVRFGSELGECRLLATGVFEMFLLRLKVGSFSVLDWADLEVHHSGVEEERKTLDANRQFASRFAIHGWRGFGAVGVEIWPAVHVDGRSGSSGHRVDG